MKVPYSSFAVFLYLDVPYQEKDLAKSLGARFDGEVKKWYYSGDARNLVKFHKWILKNKEEAIITDKIYLLQSYRKCWKCGNKTKVIAFGIGDYITIYQNDLDGEIRYELNVGKTHEDIHIAWTDEEENIPPLLLKYIKKHYAVKTGYSSVSGKCFANHCEHCGAIQGNFHMFSELDGPFYLYASSDKEMKEKVQTLEVYEIAYDNALQIDWDLYVTEQDDKYCHFWQTEITMTETEEVPTYKEMYNIT